MTTLKESQLLFPEQRVDNYRMISRDDEDLARNNVNFGIFDGVSSDKFTLRAADSVSSLSPDQEMLAKIVGTRLYTFLRHNAGEISGYNLFLIDRMRRELQETGMFGGIVYEPLVSQEYLSFIEDALGKVKDAIRNNEDDTSTAASASSSDQRIKALENDLLLIERDTKALFDEFSRQISQIISGGDYNVFSTYYESTLWRVAEQAPKIIEFLDDIETLRINLSSVREENNALTEKVKELIEAETVRDERYNQILARLAESQTSETNLMNELNDLRIEGKRCSQALDDSISTLITDLKRKESELETEKNRAVSLDHALQRQHDSTEAERQSLIRHINDLTAEMNRFKASNDIMETQSNELTAQIEKLQSQRDFAEAKIAQLEQNISEGAQRHQLLEMEIRKDERKKFKEKQYSLLLDLDEAKKLLASCRELTSTQSARIASLKNQLQTVQRKQVDSNRCAARQNELEDELTESRKLEIKLRAEVARLENERASNAEKIPDYEKDLMSVLRNVESMRFENPRDALTSLAAENQQLRSKIDILANTLNETDETSSQDLIQASLSEFSKKLETAWGRYSWLVKSYKQRERRFKRSHQTGRLSSGDNFVKSVILEEMTSEISKENND